MAQRDFNQPAVPLCLGFIAFSLYPNEFLKCILDYASESPGDSPPQGVALHDLDSIAD